VGAKMLLSDVYHPPIYITLGAVVVVLSMAVLASLWATRNDVAEPVVDVDLDPGPESTPPVRSAG
jgi:tellurite resistance protein TerC